MCDHVADHEDGGAALDLAHQRREIFERADHALRIRARGAGKHTDRRLRRTAEARASYERALELARQEPERRFLERRLEELRDGDR